MNLRRRIDPPGAVARAPRPSLGNSALRTTLNHDHSAVHHGPCVFLTLAAFLLAAFPNPTQAVSIGYSADFLPDAAGTGLPDGALVQLVVSTTNDSFDPPDADSFTGGGDDIVINETQVDSFDGLFNAGLFSGFANRPYGGAFGPGQRLLIRWWPTLQPGAATPGLNTPYGQFRPADDTTITEGSDSPFLTPPGNSDNIRVSLIAGFEGSNNNPGGDIAFNQLAFATTATPPAIPADDLELVFSSSNSSDIDIQFNTRTGQTYTIQRSDNLKTWTNVRDNISGSDSRFSWTDTGALTRGADHTFYRIVASR